MDRPGPTPPRPVAFKPKLGRPPRYSKPSFMLPDPAVPVVPTPELPNAYLHAGEVDEADRMDDALGVEFSVEPAAFTADGSCPPAPPAPSVPPDDWKPQLGLLPAIPDRPMLEMRALAVPYVLPAPPPEVHNIELDAADTGMLGNDVWGDCVFAGIEKDRVISAEALGVKITKLTAANVIAKYVEYTGVTTPPGPGAVTQLVLEWIRKTSFGWGGSHLLAFGRAPLNQTGAHETVSEFQSGLLSVTLHQSQEYPNRTWD